MEVSGGCEGVSVDDEKERGKKMGTEVVMKTKVGRQVRIDVVKCDCGTVKEAVLVKVRLTTASHAELIGRASIECHVLCMVMSLLVCRMMCICQVSFWKERHRCGFEWTGSCL